ncbi:hypothetical protein Tco_1461068 [Tanacetum coccineum]
MLHSCNGTAEIVSVLEIPKPSSDAIECNDTSVVSLTHNINECELEGGHPHRKAAMTMQCNYLHLLNQLEDTEANMEVDNFSSLTNVAELKTVVHGPENSSPAVNEKPKLTGNSSIISEGNAALTSFEASLATLTRKKKTIDRSTRLAIDCAKFGIAVQVILFFYYASLHLQYYDEA